MSVKSKGGVCDVCGCTFEKPCSDEIFGCCHWMNFDRTICSYCFWKLIVKTIVKIVGYVILNSILGLALSLFFYVLIGSVKFSILLFSIFFVGGLIDE